MTNRFLIGAAAAALLAGPASAQPNEAPHHWPALDRAQVEARVADRFARVDADRDGFVTRAEAEGARARFQAERQQRRGERRAALFARLDADGNGAISREEFSRPHPRAAGGGGEHRRMRGHPRRGHARMGERMGGGFGGQAFARLDADRDGRLSLAEATAARLQHFDRVDADRDGRISREEMQAAHERPTR